MASSPIGAGPFALRLAARALLVAILVLAAVAAVVVGRFYAVGLLLAGAAGLAWWGLRAAVLRADHSFRDLITGLTIGEWEHTGSRAPGHRAYSEAADRAVEALLAERQQAQRRVERMQALADSVPAALLIIDASGRLQLANAGAHRLAREAASRLEQLTQVGPEAAARILAIAPGGREVVRLANGRQVLGSAVRFLAPGEQPERLVTLQDVAVELDAVEVKAWQDLVRVLAHEILNSLTPISALAESLQQQGGLDDATAASIEVIARRSLGLMDFVERYRKVAEMPAPNGRPMSLAAFAGDLERLVAPGMRAANIAFSCDAGPADLQVDADRQLIEQAVINLVKNAQDAVAGVAAPRVAVACRRAEDRIEIAVSDNGPGVPAAFVDRLFVPFFTTKPEGSGIGLSLARQIALAHHGQLDATPAQPNGTVFTLALPASRAPATTQRSG